MINSKLLCCFLMIILTLTQSKINYKMAKFRINFEHSEKKVYEAIVEAENEKEAEELLKKDPFNYVEDQEGNLIEGMDFKICETVKI